MDTSENHRLVKLLNVKHNLMFVVKKKKNLVAVTSVETPTHDYFCEWRKYRLPCDFNCHSLVIEKP